MIKQFLSDVCWGELDYLIIDTPPGKIFFYLTINEWGWVSYEELWRSRRVLSVEAVGRGG